MKPLKLTWHEDPGHAWLKVPREIYTESGIEASPYSYQSPTGQLVYLEEDLDAGLFITAMKAKGCTVLTKIQYTDRPSRIRHFPRMPGKVAA